MTTQTPIEVVVPTPAGTLNLQIEFGGSMVIIGANGSGKTRLGVHIEEFLAAKDIVQRIAAQKTLALDDVQLIGLEYAETSLRYGHQSASLAQKTQYRWQNKPATQLLNDFQALLQTLFAQQNRTAVKFLDDHRRHSTLPTPLTVLQRIQDVWQRLLPHRELQLLEASIRVKPVGSQRSGQPPEAITEADFYRAGEMSDGERAIFYLLGQCLIARPNSVLVIDEPEAHVHKAIINKVWDEIEAERPDCAFIYFTHDLDFASRRTARSKYFLRSFACVKNNRKIWDIEQIPLDTGLPEHVVSEIVGSRQPILFVEGTGASLDMTICRGVYADFTPIPVGACDVVVHSVESFRRNPTLHAIGPVHGLIDGDGRSGEETALLAKLGVYVLPVAEIENLLLLPEVFRALAMALHHAAPEAAEMIQQLTNVIMARAKENIEAVSTRHAIRQLDAKLKRVGVAAKDLSTLQSTYAKEISNVDPAVAYTDMKQRLEKHIQDRDLPALLAVYDNKGLLAEAASILRLKRKSDLQDLTTRLLSGSAGGNLRDALVAAMPKIAT